MTENNESLPTSSGNSPSPKELVVCAFLSSSERERLIIALQSMFEVLQITTIDDLKSLLASDVPPLAVLLSDRSAGPIPFGFFSYVAEQYPDIGKMLLTERSSLEEVIEAVNLYAVQRVFSEPLDVDYIKSEIANSLLSQRRQLRQKSLLDSSS